MMDKNKKQILIVTAVEAERDAIMKGLYRTENIHVIAGGVGPVSAAVNTTKALCTSKYDIVISMGIGGGFVGRAEVGSIVVANKIIAADLGAETAEGFSSLDELGFGSAQLKVNQDLATKIFESLHKTIPNVHLGPILTLSTVTGTAETAAKLTNRIKGATVEAMEGFGVATAAVKFDIPVLEIRTISNPVGPREREAWRMKEAFEGLTKTSTVLQEVFS
ncbi:futalosine hydrolase [Chengkuizengella axinellae]|uniref:Futalosine hydrolase n=1 Tax=Chengkuizengella axinellae TaxID=3064388 RepID=A0ABT9J2A2_9BACL|nr:futalosine hydrolase [Chengkuizengella sp. 2205SS18-9]MDP5275129.1 futalosine hydrolase [Chengkuizengella sp. 2205SS18-9]